jgi:hypothetical protein
MYYLLKMKNLFLTIFLMEKLSKNKFIKRLVVQSLKVNILYKGVL